MEMEREKRKGKGIRESGKGKGEREKGDEKGKVKDPCTDPLSQLLSGPQQKEHFQLTHAPHSFFGSFQSC